MLSPAAPPRHCGAAQADRTRGREAVLGWARDVSEVEKGRGADVRDNPQDPREDRGSAKGKVEMTKLEPRPRGRQEAKWKGEMANDGNKRANRQVRRSRPGNGLQMALPGSNAAIVDSRV